MTEHQIRQTLAKVRALAEAVLGPAVREVDVEDPSGALLEGIVSPSLYDARDHSILLDLDALDDEIDRLLAESPRAYGEALVEAIRDRTGGALPLSECKP